MFDSKTFLFLPGKYYSIIVCNLRARWGIHTIQNLRKVELKTKFCKNNEFANQFKTK